MEHKLHEGTLEANGANCDNGDCWCWEEYQARPQDLKTPHPDDFRKPSEVYREVHGAMMSARVLRQLERRETQLDALLNHCDKQNGECGFCGETVCPYGETLHFHHDGCPACDCITVSASSEHGK